MYLKTVQKLATDSVSTLSLKGELFALSTY